MKLKLVTQRLLFSVALQSGQCWSVTTENIPLKQLKAVGNTEPVKSCSKRPNHVLKGSLSPQCSVSNHHNKVCTI